MNRSVRWLLSITAAAALPLLGGCVTEADFTVMATKNVDLSNFRTSTATGAGTVNGQDAKWIILGVPLGYASIEEAADRASDAGNTDALVNVRLKFTYWNALVVGQTKAEISGNPVVR
jgi:hypothetical protein